MLDESFAGLPVLEEVPRGLLGILGRAFSQLRVSVHQDLEVLLIDRQLNIEDCLVACRP